MLEDEYTLNDVEPLQNPPTVSDASATFPNRIDLTDENCARGRVYNVENKLKSIERHSQGPSVQVYAKESVFLKRKRLTSSSSSKGLIENTGKKHSKSKTQWFIKKMTFSRKPPKGTS